jgi:hypothetical protein
MVSAHQNHCPEHGIEIGLSLPSLRLANEFGFRGNLIMKAYSTSLGETYLNMGVFPPISSTIGGAYLSLQWRHIRQRAKLDRTSTIK